MVMVTRILLSIVVVCLATSALFAQEDNANKKRSRGFLETLLENFFSPPGAEGIDPFDSLNDPSTLQDMEHLEELAQRVPKRIEVQENFDEAIKLSQLEQRPLLFIAGAEWCGWCKKLEKELSLPEAEPILTKWIVVKIDVDAVPALATEFEANALPALRVISADRRVAGKREGYMPLTELETWLDEVAPQVDPSITRVLYETTTPDTEQLNKLVEFLGNRSPSIRQSASKRLREARAVSARLVIEVIKSGRLSQRLCAIDILRSWGAPVEELDPWQPDSILTRHIDELTEWIEDHPAPFIDEADPSKSNPFTPVDPEKIKETITQLLSEPEPKLSLLIPQAVSYGRAIVPELRARLASATDMNDSQKMLLRQLLLLGLAGEKTRGMHSDLITALASRYPETHRRAAARLLELVESDDKELIEELVQDGDPLVRESAIPALQRVGLLQQPDRLRSLLEDKSPSVRTAVLRELAQNPEMKSIELLSQHAARETDEDLLVYTAKTLGELEGESTSEEALCKLAQNSSWRVRAAALDAVGKRGENRYDHTPPAVTIATFEVVLKAADDADAFVRQRAVELIPKLMNTDNAKHVVAFLVKRPDSIEKFWADLPEHMQSKIGPSLAKASMKLLDKAEPAETSQAVLLLSKVSPDSLKRKLTTLLKSEDSGVRTAALRATVAYFEKIRDEQLVKMASSPERIASATQREPWYPVPETFKSLPAQPVEVEDVAVAAPSPANSTAATELTPIAVPRLPSSPESSENLFDGPAKPKSDNSRDETKSDQIAYGPVAIGAHTLANKLDGKLLSAWLSDWHSQYEESSGPSSIEQLRQHLRQSLSSDATLAIDQGRASPQQVEHAWLALANLACGRKEVAEKLLNAQLLTPLTAKTRLQLDALPVAIQILPWLPSDMLVKCVKDYRLKWDSDFTEPDKEFLAAITTFENQQIADWLIDEVGSRSLSNPQIVTVSDALTRALRGDHVREHRLYISIEEVVGDPPFKTYVDNPIAMQAALDWLYRKRESQLSVQQKALLMVQLLMFDYRLASQSAVGCVAQAREWNREVEIATKIALASEPIVAADRAAQWLDHPVREVRLLALERLAEATESFSNRNMEVSIPVTHQYSDDLPLFYYAARPLPVEKLREAMQDTDTDIAWNAYLLLLSVGKEELDDWKDDQIDSEQMFTVAVALAKSKRFDDAAIKFYKRAALRSEYFQQQTLGRVLMRVPNAEVKAIGKRLQEESNSLDISPF